MLYDDLVTLFPSPIHELNRAIVVAQISGPHAGIAAVESIRELDALEDYHLLHATRGELHHRAGRIEQARECFRTALKCTQSVSEHRLLMRKLQS